MGMMTADVSLAIASSKLRGRSGISGFFVFVSLSAAAFMFLLEKTYNKLTSK